MAHAHPSHTFTPQQFTDTWLLPPASVAEYRAVYDNPMDQGGD